MKVIYNKMSKLYEIDKNIALTVDTTNMQDGEKIAVKIVLVGKNKKELDIKPDTTEVQNNKASYKFKIQDIANDLNIDIKTVYSAKLWMDNDGDGIVDYNEEIKIDILRNILQSDLLKDNKILNNISSKQVNKTYSKAKPGTAVKDNEILLIQKAFQKFKINIGNDGLDGKFGGDMKKAIETFQTNYKPTHKIHDDYSLSQTGDISKDDILAIDEALVEGWENDKCNCKTIDFKLSNGKYFKVSEETLKFILSYEGFKTYAYVPKDGHGNVLGSSGITIGYGYDLGQQTSTQIASDLNGLYSSAEIIKFQSVAGLKKQSAVNMLSNVNTIITTKDIGLKLSKISKARYAQNTYDIYPELIELHPHCQGALLSIIYNRGHGLNGDRRREMKNIQTHLKKSEYSKISKEITDMKRLWTARGLLNRRDGEAKYFKKGLECI